MPTGKTKRAGSTSSMTLEEAADREVAEFSRVLAMTEWMYSHEIARFQDGPLVKLVQHARSTTEFYKDRFDFDTGSPASIRKNWQRIPILTRADAAANPQALHSAQVPKECGPVRDGNTSGSLGMPLAFKTTAASTIASGALTERMQRWWSVDGSKTFAQIAPDRMGNAQPPAGRTSLGWRPQHPNGIFHQIGLNCDAGIHLSWLVSRRATYLGVYPSVLKEMARAALRRGIECRLELAMTFAAVVDDETRELCRSAFGCEIADTYGTQEVDHLAAQCRQCGEYHISAEAAIVEVLREDGSAAAPGEIGRVIVTSLYNLAMPFIRYDVGDLAEVGSAPARCGRGLPTLRKILGRARNMFRFRDGSSIWPIAALFDLPRFINPLQFQVVQTDFDHIEIRYVPHEANETNRPIDLAGLTENVRATLRHPVEVSLRRVERIERSAGGKFEDCICMIPPA